MLKVLYDLGVVHFFQQNYEKADMSFTACKNLMSKVQFLPWKAAMLTQSWDRNSVRLSVCLSVRLSVTHVLCDETKEHTAHILIPHERVITLVFWYQQRLVRDVPFHLTFALKLTQPLWKTLTSTNIRLYFWTVRASEKCSVIANGKLTTCFPTRYR